VREVDVDVDHEVHGGRRLSGGSEVVIGGRGEQERVQLQRDI
jgi:hypothetical protein